VRKRRIDRVECVVHFDTTFSEGRVPRREEKSVSPTIDGNISSRKKQLFLGAATNVVFAFSCGRNCGDAHADNNDSRAEPKVSDAGSIRERREEWAGMCAEEEAH